MFAALQDLIQKLLERKPAKRLGMLSGKAQDVKRHRWFEGMDWAALEARRAAPPRRPKVGLRFGFGSTQLVLEWQSTAASAAGSIKSAKCSRSSESEHPLAQHSCLLGCTPRTSTVAACCLLHDLVLL